jgi:cytochrome oxidase Cu insertion factor (SCO1/SenC/PrrC family)
MTTVKMTTTRKNIVAYNILETLENWLASHSLEVKSCEVKNDPESDTPHILEAYGEFHPVFFDKETDGKRLEDLYLTELAHVDERFSGTNLFFVSDTEFKIL